MAKIRLTNAELNLLRTKLNLPGLTLAEAQSMYDDLTARTDRLIELVQQGQVVYETVCRFAEVLPPNQPLRTHSQAYAELLHGILVEQLPQLPPPSWVGD